MTPVGERGKNVLLETGKSCRRGACWEFRQFFSEAGHAFREFSCDCPG